MELSNYHNSAARIDNYGLQSNSALFVSCFRLRPCYKEGSLYLVKHEFEYRDESKLLALLGYLEWQVTGAWDNMKSFATNLCLPQIQASESELGGKNRSRCSAER